MPYSQSRGQVGKTENLGKIIYVGDGTSFYPVLADTAGLGGTNARPIISQREPFLFRIGSTALASGMVASGTRSSAATITSGTATGTTYYTGWLSYSPLRSGKIDGLTSGGIIDGQITVGAVTGAGTGTCKLLVDIANTANTGSPTTMLALTGTITITNTEAFFTYDIPYLACDTVMNSVPFSVRMGIQTSQAASTVVGRIMENSYIQGEFEPGT